ncbi:hypothetical protein REPUB_Repub07fG0047500 [Reevesia pubescens]
MGESRSTHLGKVCDTCGNVGYEELIRICSQCTIRRHLYCMMVLVMDVPDDWVCEVCLPKNEIDSLKSGQTEDVQDSSRKVCFNLGRQVACKRQKAVETGKVKFLPTEEVIKLSSGLPKMPFPLMRNFRSKPAPENFTPSPSRRTFVGSTTVGPYFNPNKEKRNPSFLQLGSANPPRCGVVQISSSISQHASKTSKKLKEDEETAPQTLAKKYSSNEEPASSVMAAKEVKTVNSKAMNSMRETCSASATSKLCLSIVNKGEGAIVVPTKENVCKGQTLDAIPPDKENRILHTKTDETTRPSRPSASRLSTTIVGSGRNFHDASESEHSDVAETETWNRLKISLYRPHLPALYPIWTGGFKFLDTATPGEFYGGFLAQPPCKVHRKAYEFSQKMPPVLQVNLLLQCHLQADLFQNGCLDLCDIALYIFPVNYIERSQKNYNELFQLMEMKSSVMISYIDGVELLIFTSKQLHVGSRDIFTKSNTDFFCGVFRHAKQNRSKVHQKLPPLVSPLEYTHDDNANMESSKAFDMDIDMVGGKIVGIPDMVVSKESTWEFNEQVARETLDPITDRKFSTVSGDLSFVIQPISLEFKQERHNDSDLRSKSTEKIKSKFILKRVEHPLESSLGRSTGRIGEIDILPGFEVISKQNSRDRAPKAPIAEEKNDLDKRGTMNQVKEEIGCQGTLQVAFGVSRPQRQEYIDDASLRGSQKQHQILKTSDHLVNGPSAACPPPPRLFGEGNEVESVIKIDGNENEKPFERREKKGLQGSPFLSKDKSQTISGSLCHPCLVEVKAEVQEVVNDPSAACPSRLLNKGTKIGLQTKTQEHDREKPDETRDKKGVQGSLFVSKDKSKMIAGCINDPCAAGVKAEMHTTLPSNMETSICLGPFASTRVKLCVAGRSRGNAGAASVGGLIRDEAGKWIVGYNLNLGIYDCLQTNLWALFLGIKFTWDRGYRKVLVESDSITAVEFLKKAPSQPNSNRVLIERCIELLSRKWDCKVYTIQREKNLCANWLATHVEGCSLGMSIINVPPSELIPLLEDDCIQVARALDSPSAECFSTCKSH